MAIVRIFLLQQRHGGRIQIYQIGQLALVQLLEDSGLQLSPEKVGAGHHQIEAGIAREQLGLQQLVAVEHIVDHLYAGLLFEVGYGVLGDIVAPVIDMQDLLFGRLGLAQAMTQGK